MSTISLNNERQIRHLYVGDAIASETSAIDFKDTASIGEIQIFNAEGTAFTYADAPADGGDFYIAKLNQKGDVSISDKISPGDITNLTGFSPVDKVGKITTFTLTNGPTDDAEYRLSIKLQYGTSSENTINFMVGVLNDQSYTAEELLDNLAAQMLTQLAASSVTSLEGATVDNKYFSIAVATPTITITEKDWIADEYRAGLVTNDQLIWNAEIEGTEYTNATKDVTEEVFPTGQGYQMQELERFLVRHRAVFPGQRYDLSFERDFDTDENSTYYGLELSYYDTSRDSSKQSKKMLTLISEDATVVDAIGFAIEAQMGYAEGTKWSELDPNADGADNA